LLRLQGGVAAGDAAGSTDEAADGNGLATTVGKAERAAQAVDVVEKK
jgi:kinetochor protein Mis14/NSL1